MADFALLTKILLYEVQKGYNDSAVINGLSAFVSTWRQAALGADASSGERARIQALTELLGQYALRIVELEMALKMANLKTNRDGAGYSGQDKQD